MDLRAGLRPFDASERSIKDLKWLEKVASGMLGMNKGIASQLRLFNKLHGIHEERYTLIGAHPNIGKTQFTDFVYVFSLWHKAKEEGRPIKILYGSLELSVREKKAKWCSTFLYFLYGIVWSSDFIMGRIPDKYPDNEQYKLIKEAFKYVDAMCEDIYFIERSMTPDNLFNQFVDSYYTQYGTVVREPVSPKMKEKGIRGQVTNFIQTKPVPFTVFIVDHLALLAGHDKKAAMDRMSELGIVLRNVFRTCFVPIQQFNQGLVSTRRESVIRQGSQAVLQIAPKQIDFGDSTYTFRDADYVIGLVKPFKFDQTEFDGIPCELPYYDGQSASGGLGDCLIVPFVIKNRHGPVDLMSPLFMHGITGFFADLPRDLDPNWSPWIEEAYKILTHG